MTTTTILLYFSLQEKNFIENYHELNMIENVGELKEDLYLK